MPRSIYWSLLILFHCVYLLPLSLNAKTYTVKTIPNIYKQSVLTYVSNPDLIISEEDVYEMNSKLIRLEKESSHEVVVAAVHSIGMADSKEFAHKLFNLWKIGKKETNNGLLILLVVDKREVVFETGTGLQTQMTDEVCYEIQQEWMIPLLKDNNYSEGLLAGVDGVINFLKTGYVSKVIPPKVDTQKTKANLSTGTRMSNLLEVFSVWWLVTFLIALSSLVYLMISSRYSPIEKKKRLESRITRCYFWLILLGVNIIGVILLMIIYKLYTSSRNHAYRCLSCGSYKCKILYFDSQKDYLTPEERDNEKRGICEYSVVVCKSCNYHSKKEKVAPNYTRCPSCNGFVVGIWLDNIITLPTSETYGKKERTLKCHNCNTVSSTQELIIPLSNNNVPNVNTDNRGFEVINNISNNSIYIDNDNYNRYDTDSVRRNSEYSSSSNSGRSSYNSGSSNSTTVSSSSGSSRSGGSSSGGGSTSSSSSGGASRGGGRSSGGGATSSF